MTAPLVPPFVSLRHFPDMPLDVALFRDSKLAVQATDAGFRSAVLLMCAAWHQVPAGSLPDDDKALADLAGYGRAVREWAKVRDDALHKWKKCSDGRLYHPVIAKKALFAWNHHCKQAFRTECARLKKSAQRAGTEPIYPEYDDWKAGYETTGDPKWPDPSPSSGPNVPRDNSQCPGGQPPMSRGTSGNVPRDVPGEKASIGSDRIGSKSPVSTNTASVEILGVASAMARALQGMGYSDCSERHPHLVTAASQGLTADEIRAAADKPGKPVAYIVARAMGRRSDAADQATGQSVPAAPVPIDPAERQRLAQREVLERKIYDIRHRCSHLEEITPEERDRQIEQLLAAAAPAAEGALS